MDNVYLSIDRETIRRDTVQEFDVFFRSGEDKMVLYSAGGKGFDADVSEKIREHSIDRLYIQKKDRVHYHSYVENNLETILENPSMEAPRKAAVAYQSVNFIAEQLFKTPKAEFIKRYKRVVFQTLDMVLKIDAVLRELIRLTTFDFNISNHSINVGIFSIGLMREFIGDYTNHDTREIATGFFLHDIGKCRIPPEILFKKAPLSPAEWKCMRGHVDEGCKMLADVGLLTNAVQIIISQHHERYDGSGYPQGIRGDKIHPYAKICSIADVFDGLTSFRPFRKEYSSFEAMKIMKNEMFRDFDPVYFQKFVRLFSSP